MPFSRKKEGCCKETGCEPLAGIRAPLERVGTRDAAGRSGLGKTTPEGKDPTAAGIPCPCLLQFGAAAPRSPWLCRSPQLSSSSLRPAQPWVPQLRASSSKSLPVRGEQDESLPTPHLVSTNSRSTSPSASTGFNPTAPTPGQQHPEDTQPWLLRRQAAASVGRQTRPQPQGMLQEHQLTLHQCLPQTGSRTEWCCLSREPRWPHGGTASAPASQCWLPHPSPSLWHPAGVQEPPAGQESCAAPPFGSA